MDEATPAWAASAQAASEAGMGLARIARLSPGRIAVIDPHGQTRFDELNARANQLLARLRHAGLGEHSAVALICSNRSEFLVVHAAANRGGMRLVPVNWHLTGEEMAYIVNNSDAEALIAEARFAPAARAAADAAPALRIRLAIDGPIRGFADFHRDIEGGSPDDPDDPRLGSPMLYTSGTTGHPKGVYRWPPRHSPILGSIMSRLITFRPETDLTLVPGPIYHAAPLNLNTLPSLHAGVGLVLMDRFDAEQMLARVAEHGIAYTHVVATMFNRLLKLPEAVRRQYDVSSLRAVLHGAAPCPEHVKRAVIDWFGPVVFEYYAATEGGATLIDSAAWLERPGSVGQAIPGTGVRVLNDELEDCAPDEVGAVYLMAPEQGRFVYYKASDKTDSAYHGGWFTLGDRGRLDADGYLYLTGRDAETIISGGVNIYPQEIDDVLLQFPGVHDACTIGIPNEDWGEEVRAVVRPEAGITTDETFIEALIAHCREHLAGFKCPRSVTFADHLPRLPSGKMQRHKVRAPYWDEPKHPP